MEKLIAHLWFDHEALEASKFYVGLFDDAEISNVYTLKDTPSGDVEMIDFRLANLNFTAISAGPYFKFNGSVSLMVACETPEEVDHFYEALTQFGKVRMPLDAYPFSARYAWVEDRYGLNWQLILTEAPVHKVRPNFLFVTGEAEAALAHYESIFDGASIGFVNRYQPGEAVDPKAKINYSELNLLDQQLVLMDHGYGGEEGFNEAFSLMVLCENQVEVDTYWNALSHVPEAEQCGWLQDAFGVSWQIVPIGLDALMRQGTEAEIERATKAVLSMKKLDIAAIEKASA
jgi:predicted 3-demethylubiquinone-9 3-methyltransferase (glyoxalase superfamily)